MELEVTVSQPSLGCLVKTVHFSSSSGRHFIKAQPVLQQPARVSLQDKGFEGFFLVLSLHAAVKSILTDFPLAKDSVRALPFASSGSCCSQLICDSRKQHSLGTFPVKSGFALATYFCKPALGQLQGQVFSTNIIFPATAEPS